jgi:anaerobic magnesium-protoporphyrin IX monomethyl ester cyclase
MHVTLINPPTISTPTTYAQEAVPPLGLAYVARAVLDLGHEIEVVDAVGDGLEQFRLWSGPHRSMLRGLDFGEIVRRVPERTDVIGVSAMFSNAWGPTRELLLRLRAAHPRARIVLGGEHATACHRYVLDTCPAVDYCVLGEGERSFSALLDALERGGPPPLSAGLASREGGGDGGPILQVAPGRRRPRIRDIGSIAAPAWSQFPIEAYVSGGFNHGVQRGRTMPILASRGCPYQCAFCSSPNMWTTRWQVREPADVLAEMKQYIERYRVNDFAFYDLTAIVKRRWIVDFCRLLIQEDLAITWQLPSGTRSEAIDAEVAQLLFRSGCRNMNYAPESGSPGVLERVKKRIVIPRLLESIRAALTAGIEVKVNIILGFPDESPRELLETYRFLARLGAMGVDAVSVFPFCPYPGSELFDHLVRRGRLQLTEGYFDDLVYTDLGRIRSYNDRVGPKELQAQVVGALAIFHGSQTLFSPGRVWGMARQIASRTQAGKIANAIEPMRRRRQVWRKLRGSEARKR